MKKKLFDDDEEFSMNEDGLIVFTETYLLQRGYCCGNGCRHCPFEYKQVADPIKKMKLLEAKKARDNQAK